MSPVAVIRDVARRSSIIPIGGELALLVIEGPEDVFVALVMGSVFLGELTKIGSA